MCVAFSKHICRPRYLDNKTKALNLVSHTGQSSRKGVGDA